MSIPIPSPKAVRVSVSNPSKRELPPPVFGMDIERDIAYPYTSRCRKRNGKFSSTCAVRRCRSSHDEFQLYALILAGGSGERFWPLSRRARPKQLLRLVSEKTLLEETIARLDGLVPPSGF